MPVLLVSMNKELNPYPVAPLGLAYIATALAKAGQNVSVADLCFSAEDKETLRDMIKRNMPELIGISIRNIDNLTYPKSIFYLPYIKEITNFIKTLSKALIVAGGSGFSLFPEESLRYLGIKYGIIGEGESAMTSIANRISVKKDFHDIPNLCYIENNLFFSNTVLREEEFHDFSSPDRRFVDNIAYSKLGGMANVQTKRGCPFNCIYCTYPYINGNLLRLRNPSDIAGELEELKYKYEVNHVFFVDDIFNCPEAHASGICEEIIRKKININWTCFATPKGITKELVGIMKRAGCSGIEFGTDSGSEKMLNNLSKSFSLVDVEKATEACRDVDLPAAHYVIIGGPGENKETLEETFSFFDSLRPDAVIALTGLRIYPNTKLLRLSRNEGIVPEGKSLLEPEFYISSRLGADNMLAAVKSHALSRPNWIVPGLDIRCSTAMLTMLRRLGKQGPLWDLLVAGN